MNELKVLGEHESESSQLYSATELDFLTVKDVCELTGVQPHHVRYLIRKGTIPSVRIGHGFFIPASYYEEELAAAPDFIPEARRAAIMLGIDGVVTTPPLKTADGTQETLCVS